MRLHYSARVGATARHGKAYRGIPAGSPRQSPDLVPVTDDLIECPVCHGGVRTVPACFSDIDSGIVHHKTQVIASHREGGIPGGGRDKCAGTHRKATA